MGCMPHQDAVDPSAFQVSPHPADAGGQQNRLLGVRVGEGPGPKNPPIAVNRWAVVLESKRLSRPSRPEIVALKPEVQRAGPLGPSLLEPFCGIGMNSACFEFCVLPLLPPRRPPRLSRPFTLLRRSRIVGRPDRGVLSAGLACLAGSEVHGSSVHFSFSTRTRPPPLSGKLQVSQRSGKLRRAPAPCRSS